MVWQDKNYVDRYNKLYVIKTQDIKTYIDILDLKPSDTLVDFGCGKGDFLLEAAPKVKKVIGIDLTIYQLNYLKKKTIPQNIELIQSSFLECDLDQYSLTKGFARISLHHITDEEKYIFFKKIGKHFENKAYFLLYDAIFDFNKNNLPKKRDVLIEEAKQYYGDQWEIKKNDILNTWFNEYPTDFDTWSNSFVEGKFQVIKRWQITSFLGMILAQKFEKNK